MKKLIEKIKQIPRKWLIIAGLLIIAPFVLNITGIWAFGTWRYKITVVVETPEGIKEGYSVIQLRNSASIIKILDLPAAGNSASVKGEAVVVDLGERGKVFSLVTGAVIFYNAFGNASGATTVKGIKYFNRVPIGKEVTLDPSKHPRIVAFTDITDPKTVTLVKGGRFNPKTQGYDAVDRFEELFGKGVYLKEVRIQKTRERVTWKVDQYLPKTYDEVIIKGWRELSNAEKHKLYKMTDFKKGK